MIDDRAQPPADKRAAFARVPCHIGEALVKHGTAAAWAILFVILRDGNWKTSTLGPISDVELAKRIGLHIGTISRACKVLQAAGVEIERAKFAGQKNTYRVPQEPSANAGHSAHGEPSAGATTAQHRRNESLAPAHKEPSAGATPLLSSEKTENSEQQQRAGAAAAGAAPGRQAEPAASERERAALPVLDALDLAGVDDPTRKRLALEMVDTMSPEDAARLVRAESQRARAKGKDAGAVVEALRGSIRRAKLPKPTPPTHAAPPSPSPVSLKTREADARAEEDRRGVFAWRDGVDDVSLAAAHRAAIAEAPTIARPRWETEDPRTTKNRGLLSAMRNVATREPAHAAGAA